MKKKVILIIDDEEKILNILEEGLELKDLYEIEVSQTSSEFIDLVGQIKYDVLLLDHKMPVKDRRFPCEGDTRKRRSKQRNAHYFYLWLFKRSSKRSWTNKRHILFAKANYP